jgi:hypothetical protein
MGAGVGSLIVVIVLRPDHPLPDYRHRYHPPTSSCVVLMLLCVAVRTRRHRVVVRRCCASWFRVVVVGARCAPYVVAAVVCDDGARCAPCVVAVCSRCRWPVLVGPWWWSW